MGISEYKVLLWKTNRRLCQFCVFGNGRVSIAAEQLTPVLFIMSSEDGEQQWRSVYLWISICAPFGQWTMYQFYLGRFAFHCDWTGSNITMQHTDIASSHHTGIILFLITSKWKCKKRTVKQLCWSFFLSLWSFFDFARQLNVDFDALLLAFCTSYLFPRSKEGGQ